MDDKQPATVEVETINTNEVLETPPDLGFDGAVVTEGIQYGQARLTTLGQEVKNAVGYSLYATAIVSLFIVVFFHGKTDWTAEEIGIIYSSGVPLIDGALVVLKRLLDRVL